MNILKLYCIFRLNSLLFQDKKFKAQSNKPRLFVFLAADYGNLGDVAITYAQEKILNDFYPDYEIIDVPISKTLSLLHPIKKSIKPNDIITITGGGNMGGMYGDIELLRLMVIRMFPENKIVVFPQTTDYNGNNNFLFRLAQKTYNKHKNIILLAREEVTYARLNEWFPFAKSLLVPDVVMTLDKWENKERNGIVFCLRDDKEKKPCDQKVFSIMEEAKSMGIKTIQYDTHINNNFMSLDECKHELNKIWKIFSNSQLVVTDRLHGMVFAYITGTPAIVFPNNNFKIEKCYEWIRNSGYIFFCKEESMDLHEVIGLKVNRSIFENNNKRFIQMIKEIL